jgi:hypothetical protein
VYKVVAVLLCFLLPADILTISSPLLTLSFLPRSRLSYLSHSARFVPLPQLPVDSLTLRQVFQIRLHDALQPLQESSERLRLELTQAREQARAAEENTTQELRQATHRAAIAEAQAAGLREQHALQETTVARLSGRVDELLRQVESLLGKGATFDAVDARRRELEVGRKQLRSPAFRKTLTRAFLLPAGAA